MPLTYQSPVKRSFVEPLFFECESLDHVRQIDRPVNKAHAIVSNAAGTNTLIYKFDRSSVAADDGLDVLRPDDTDVLGRWRRIGVDGSINVRWLGAVGDGDTDDTVSIEAAINAMPASGGKLIFPPGTYVTTGNVVISKRIAIEGYGATIKLADGTTDCYAMLKLNADGISVRGLLFDGNHDNIGVGNPTEPCNAIQVASDYCLLENIYMFDNADGFTTANGERGALLVSGNHNNIFNVVIYNPYNNAFSNTGDFNEYRNIRAYEYGQDADSGKGFVHFNSPTELITIDGFEASTTKTNASEALLIDPNIPDTFVQRFVGRNMRLYGPDNNPIQQNIMKFELTKEVYLENVFALTTTTNLIQLRDQCERMVWNGGMIAHRWISASIELRDVAFNNVKFSDGSATNLLGYNIKIEDGVESLRVINCELNDALVKAVEIERGDAVGSHADKPMIIVQGCRFKGGDAGCELVGLFGYTDGVDAQIHAGFNIADSGGLDTYGPRWNGIRMSSTGSMYWTDADGADDGTQLVRTEAGKLMVASQLGVGASPPASYPFYVEGANGFLLVQQTATDETIKSMRVITFPYSNANGNVCWLSTAADITVNTLSLGGGTSTSKAATKINFVTAPDVDTVTGTNRGTVDATGNLIWNSILTLAAGGYIQGSEISDPSAPATDNGRLYFRDNGAGKTQLAVRFPTGAIQVLATEP